MRSQSSTGLQIVRVLLAIFLASAVGMALQAHEAFAGRCGNAGHAHFVHVGYPRHLGYGDGYAYTRGCGYVRYPRYRHYGYASGLSVGPAITNLPPAGYYYYDPYCDRSFSSLDVYLDHLDDGDHPRRIQVIDFDTGYPAYAYRYRGDRWGYCE